MEKDYEVKKEGSVLTIVLGTSLSTQNAPALSEELAQYKDQGVEEVVFDATRLTHLTSSGVRVIIFCKQKLSSKPKIVIVNCNNEILDIFDIVGLRKFLTFENK